MAASQRFRFLDLPKELRLIIYEKVIVIQSTSHPVTIRDEGVTTITLYDRSLSTAVLATCRSIHDEASYILERQLKQILAQPPRLDISLPHLPSSYRPLSTLLCGVYLACIDMEEFDFGDLLNEMVTDFPHLWDDNKSLEALLRFVHQSAHYRNFQHSLNRTDNGNVPPTAPAFELWICPSPSRDDTFWDLFNLTFIIRSKKYGIRDRV